MQPDDDEAWRGIVDNYGERVELEPDEPDEPTPEPAALAETPVAPETPAPEARTWDDPDSDSSTDRFVPPEPPPVPMASHDRLVAWIGLFGSPAALIICLVLGVSLPSWAAFLLVAAFVAGFVYLVVRMPREPRDPGDDGAVL